MSNHIVSLGLFKDGSVGNDGSDEVWVDVGGWTSVFDVAFSVVVSCLCWNSEGCGSVSSSIRELLE